MSSLSLISTIIRREPHDARWSGNSHPIVAVVKHRAELGNRMSGFVLDHDGPEPAYVLAVLVLVLVPEPEWTRVRPQALEPQRGKVFGHTLGQEFQDLAAPGKSVTMARPLSGWHQLVPPLL
jgi:hypothetical protein